MPTAFHAHCLLLYFVQPLLCRGTPNLLSGWFPRLWESYRVNVSGLRAAELPAMSLSAHVAAGQQSGKEQHISASKAAPARKITHLRRCRASHPIPSVLLATYRLLFFIALRRTMKPIKVRPANINIQSLGPGSDAWLKLPGHHQNHNGSGRLQRAGVWGHVRLCTLCIRATIILAKESQTPFWSLGYVRTDERCA